MDMYKKILLGVMILAGSYTANAQSKTSHPAAVGSGIAAVVGDFDNDGKPDLMSVSKIPYDDEGGVYLISDFFGTPKKTAYVATFSMDVNSGVEILAGDYDGDGDLDFVVGARPYPRERYVVWNKYRNNISTRSSIEGYFEKF